MVKRFGQAVDNRSLTIPCERNIYRLVGSFKTNIQYILEYTGNVAGGADKFYFPK